jgi:hypothetical protein
MKIPQAWEVNVFMEALELLFKIGRAIWECFLVEAAA